MAKSKRTRAPLRAVAGGPRRRARFALALCVALACATGVLACANPASTGEGVAVLFEESRELRPPEPGPHGAAKGVGRSLWTVVDRRERVEIASLRRTLVRTDRGADSPVAVVQRNTLLLDGPDGELLTDIGTETEFDSPRVMAVLDHSRGWLEVFASELPNGETGWIWGGDVEIDSIDYELRVDLSERTLEVYRDGELARRVVVAVGGPTTPTPTGTFAVTDKLRLTDRGTPYGCCALALTGHQPNIPQGWSGGDRIAVHGTPYESTVGGDASLGCLRATEVDMRWLIDAVPLGTRVRIEA